MPPALLTRRDAVEVLAEHFHELSGTAEVVEGRYIVRCTSGLAGILQGIERRELEATSVASFEDAIRQLAGQSAAVESLDDPTGVFQMLLRHRAGGDGQLFKVRHAPLSAETCRALDSISVSLERLRSHLRPRVEFSRERGGAAHQADVFAQAILHRSVALVDGAAAEWNRGNGVTATVLGRALLETVAVWAKALKKADEYLTTDKFDEYDTLLVQLFFGSKNPRQRVGGLDPIHVLTAMDTLDKRFPGVRRTYDELSEIAHPNGTSLFGFFSPEEGMDATFDIKAYTDDLLGDVLRGLRLDVAEWCVAESRRLSDRLVGIWHRVHRSAGH